jgi:GNAT superfamily N-acetyltransferase
MITIRRAKIEDKPAIFDFIRKAYKDVWKYRIPDRWNWEFVDNPFVESEELPIWIAVDGNKEVVGQCCAMIERIKLGNTIRQMAWGVDFYVDQNYRGQGLGTKINEANYKSHEIFMGLSMDVLTSRINSKSGFESIESVSTFIRVNQLSPDEAVKEVVNQLIPRGAIIKRNLAKLFRYLNIDQKVAEKSNKKRSQMDENLAKSIDSGLSITQIDQFDQEIDQLWEEVSPHFFALIKRDHVYLNWKFVRQPHVEHIKYIARRQGKICGYIIIRKGIAPEPNIGIIVDIFVSPNEKTVLTALISKAVDFFVAEQVRSIVSATNVNAYQEALKNFGFKKITEHVPMVYFNVFDSDCVTSLQPGKWLLGKGDQDWDQYPRATDYR